MTLIRPQSIAFTATVTEEELRKRMTDEVLESIGALQDDGTPAPGVHAHVKRGVGRSGGYVITVTGPAPVRVQLPSPQSKELKA